MPLIFNYLNSCFIRLFAEGSISILVWMFELLRTCLLGSDSVFTVWTWSIKLFPVLQFLFPVFTWAMNLSLNCRGVLNCLTILSASPLTESPVNWNKIHELHLSLTDLDQHLVLDVVEQVAYRVHVLHLLHILVDSQQYFIQLNCQLKQHSHEPLRVKSL